MNQHQLLIEARARPEVLERILRVVRHRGFQISTMHMCQENDKGSINIDIKVSSLRNIVLLSSQLEKLIDVDRVQTIQQTTQQIRA